MNVNGCMNIEILDKDYKFPDDWNFTLEDNGDGDCPFYIKNGEIERISKEDELKIREEKKKAKNIVCKKLLDNLYSVYINLLDFCYITTKPYKKRAINAYYNTVYKLKITRLGTDRIVYIDDEAFYLYMGFLAMDSNGGLVKDIRSVDYRFEERKEKSNGYYNM